MLHFYVKVGNLPLGSFAKLMLYSVSLKMRRPPVLQFNKWMGECLNLLKNSSSPHDRQVAAWTELQRIADEVAISLGFDDPSTEIDLDDARLQVIVKAFDRRMEEWNKNVEPEIRGGKCICSPCLGGTRENQGLMRHDSCARRRISLELFGCL